MTKKATHHNKAKNRNTHHYMRKPPVRDILYGQHAVVAALLNPKRKINKIYALNNTASIIQEALIAAKNNNLLRPDIEIIDRQRLIQLAGSETVHQGLAIEALPLEQPMLEEIIEDDGMDSILIGIDQITDPQNIGAIFRLAAAFKAKAIITPDHGCPELSGAIAKVAVGAVENIPFIRVSNLSRALDLIRQENYWVIGLAEQAQQNLRQAKNQGKQMLVFGSEGTGLRRLTREKCDILAKLPTNPAFPSLNVATAVAISLYELTANG